MKRGEAKRRRAIVFSLITIVVSAFMILLFWNLYTPPLDITSSAVESRVEVVDHYLSSWDAYIKDATIVTTRASLTTLTLGIDPATPKGTVADMKRNLSSCLRYGKTSYDNDPNFACFGNVNLALTNKLDNFSRLAQDELNINTTYTIGPTIGVEETAPFELKVSFVVNYSVTDAQGIVFARWNRTRAYDVFVNVEGLPDPLFVRYGDTKMQPAQKTRNLTRYPMARDLLDDGNLTALIKSRAYVENRGTGYTYLQRLAGDLGVQPDPANGSGIETFIIPSETLPAALPAALYKNTSFTDHQYFSGKTYGCPRETVHLNLSQMPAAYAPYANLYLTVSQWHRYGKVASEFNETCG